MIPELAVEPQVAETDEGRAYVWRPKRDLVFTRVEGRFAMPHAQLIMDQVDDAVRANQGKVTIVHDWTAVESYEVVVHARMSAWAVAVMRSLTRVVIGVTSPFVALAVRTVNLAVGNRFEVVDTRDKVLAEARAELARR